MAEKLCELRKKGGGGGKQTETVLWTNPNPTSSFASQTVSLSDSIDNYKYIKFTWKTTTTDTSSSSAYVLSSDLASMTNSNGSRFLSLSSLWTNVYSRNITYNSATSVSIATSTRQGASGNNNGVNIPLEILGINELAHGKMSDMATIFASTDATRSVDRGYTSNSSLFTVTDTIASNPTNKITVLEDGNYEYIAMTGNRSTGTAYVKIGDTVVADTFGVGMVVQHGNMYIQANTECLVYTATATSALNTATLTLIKL